jgi:hypothetical protein
VRVGVSKSNARNNGLREPDEAHRVRSMFANKPEHIRQRRPIVLGILVFRRKPQRLTDLPLMETIGHHAVALPVVPSDQQARRLGVPNDSQFRRLKVNRLALCIG